MVRGGDKRVLVEVGFFFLEKCRVVMDVLVFLFFVSIEGVENWDNVSL